MRLIYVDEAGTSPNEPVRVVASVIVHGDDQARSLTAELERVISERVPKNLRDGFIFHGLEVFNGGKKIDRREWSFEERLDFFKEVVCLPFVHDVPIALGIVFSGAYDEGFGEAFVLHLKNKKIHHVTEHGIAFAKCLAKADQFLNKYLDGNEVGTVIVENIDSNKKMISDLAMLYQHKPIRLAPTDQIRTIQDKLLDRQPDEFTLEIKNIIDVPHFVEKKGARLLQLADACAFAFRRYLARQRHGEDLVLAMLGPPIGMAFIKEPAWFSGASSGLFNTDKYWNDEQRKQNAENDLRLRLATLFSGKAPS